MKRDDECALYMIQWDSQQNYVVGQTFDDAIRRWQEWFSVEDGQPFTERPESVVVVADANEIHPDLRVNHE